MWTGWKNRNFIEEHVFSIDWFGGADEKKSSNYGFPSKKIKHKRLNE